MKIYITNLDRNREPKLPKMTEDILLFKDLKWLVEVTRNNLHDELGYFTQKYMGISLWGFLESNGYYSPRIEGFEAKYTATKTTLIVILRTLHGEKLFLKVLVPQDNNKELVLKLETGIKVLLEAKSLLSLMGKGYMVSYAYDYFELILNIVNNLEMGSVGFTQVGSSVNHWSILLENDESVVLRIKESGKEQAARVSYDNQ